MPAGRGTKQDQTILSVRDQWRYFSLTEPPEMLREEFGVLPRFGSSLLEGRTSGLKPHAKNRNKHSGDMQ